MSSLDPLNLPEALRAEVFITHELLKRAAKPPNHLAEKRALQELAGLMADHPSEVLPRFVDLAMTMTGGTSAGLSLFEQEPAPGVFRWHHVCGTLARFDGTTTPRNDSPCGVTLDELGPVLTCHAERIYRWIADAGIVVPEVLLVPIFVGTQALGTLWIVSDDTGHFNAGHSRVASELATFVGIALRMVRTEEQLRQALAAQNTLAHEMSHRVKNIFAVVGAMIQLGSKGAKDKEDLERTLSGRVRALASAHQLVLARETAAEPTDLALIVKAVIEPHESVENPRFRLDGPPVMITPEAISGIALVIHELTTNAIKYGSLKSRGGSVTLTWTAGETALAMLWQERGGAGIQGPPDHVGFGSRLVNTTIVRQFGGSVTHHWEPEGVTVQIEVPLDTIGTTGHARSR